MNRNLFFSRIFYVRLLLQHQQNGIFRKWSTCRNDQSQYIVVLYVLKYVNYFHADIAWTLLTKFLKFGNACKSYIWWHSEVYDFSMTMEHILHFFSPRFIFFTLHNMLLLFSIFHLIDFHRRIEPIVSFIGRLH